MAYAGLKEIYGVGKTQKEKDEENEKRKIAYEEARKECGIKTVEVDDDYINKYIEDSNNFSKTVQMDFGNVGYNNAQSSYRNYLRKSESLSYRTGRISEYLEANKSRYDTETYNDLMSYLDNNKKSFATARKSFSNARDYFSQWETEKDYNDYIKSQEETTKLLSYDTQKAGTEISDIDKQIKELKTTLSTKEALYDSRYANNSNGVNYGVSNENSNITSPLTPGQSREAAELSKEISDYKTKIEELENQRSEKYRYYNAAKNLQDREALTENATKAGDFKAYSEKGVNNKITQTKNKFSSTDSFSEDLTLTRDQRFAKYLTDDELDVYEYYIGKGDNESAEAYLNSIEDTVNARKGLEIYDLVEDKTALEFVFGVAAGFDQSTGIGNLFTDKEHYSTSAFQQASALIREDLDDVGFKIGDVSIGQIGYDLVTTTSNMLPSILASTATAALVNTFAPGVGGFVGEAVGSVLLGASAAGNAYAEMVNLGYEKSQAKTYAAMIGASEAGLQVVLGGIGKLGGYAAKGVTEKALTSIDNALAKGAIKFGDAFSDVAKKSVEYGGKMFSEGLEEYMQDILDPFFKNIAFHEKNNVDLFTSEALYSGVLGALSAGLLDVIPSAVADTANTVETYKTGKKALKEVGVERLKKLGQTFSADSVAYKIADRIDENTGAYTVGKLLNEAGAELTQQNQTDVANALVERGIAQENAETISKWLTRVVDGVKLTKKQQFALENNEVISQVFQDVIINKNSTFNQRRQNFFEMTKSNEYAGINQNTDVKGNNSAYNEKVASIGKISENSAQQNSTNQNTESVSERNYNSDILRGENETNKTKKAAELSEYGVSDDGKTILNTASGAENVEIKGVAFTNGKEMTLELADGRKVNSKDIEYGTEDEAIVYEAVADMAIPTDVANNLLQNYSPEQSGREYALGVKEAYKYGYYNYSMDELMSRASFAPELTEIQRITAYNLGKSMSKADFKTVTGKKGYSKSGLVFDGDRETLNSKQKASLTALENIAEITGLQIKVFESEAVDGIHIGKNGSFNVNTSEMEIDLYSGNEGQGIMLHTASHELVHFIRQWSAEKYKVLADFLTEQYGKKGVSTDTLVNRQIEKAEAAGRKISYAEAHEEVIADSMETMLDDGEVIEKLKLLNAKDKTLYEKIKEYISELVEKIKNAYKNVRPETVEGEIISSMLDKIEQLQQLFVEAIAGATENFKNAEVVESVSSENRFSIKDNPIEKYTQRQYNDYGWVTFNKVLTGKELRKLYSQFANIKLNKNYNFKNSRGEYIIPVGDRYNSIDNIVYIKGTNKHPIICKVLAFNKHKELAEEIVREIIDYESSKYCTDAYRIYEAYAKEKIFTIHTLSDYIEYSKARYGTGKQDNRGTSNENRKWSEGKRDTGIGEREISDDAELKLSDRDPNALTPRNLLANALESSAVHEVEKKKLAEYKKNINNLYAKEQELYEVRKQIKEIYNAPGKRDTVKLKQLRERATALSNNVDVYDKKLLNLESTSFLKNVIEREKAEAIRKQKQKDAEILKRQKEKALQKEKAIADRYKESRKKSVENREKTVIRNKIKRKVNELNSYLLNNTKDKHVMDNMKKAVAEALDIVNMDTVGADERVSKYNDLIAKETDPDIIASLTQTRDRIQKQGDNLSEKLRSLKEAYANIINSDDPVIANAYDEVVENRILSVAMSIENISIRDMTRQQLEDVYNLYKMVLTNVRNSNKAFKAAKDETITELGYKVNSEVEKVTTQKYKTSALKKYISKYGWNELKPIYAFRMIGSETFQRLFNNILRGQDTWYRDVKDGKRFQQKARKKYNYRKWDFEKRYTFESKSGKAFDLTLQQIMSLYAFSRREQALKHLVQGGFVFDKNVKVKEKVKGVPQKYEVITTDAFNLSSEIIGEIVGNLTSEQKSFVEEMQAYLSDVMGGKGNEVSTAMYGIKLFKEKNYFPLKSSEQYMNFVASEAGEVKLKNSGFSKETIKKANNPVILSDFMDVWAKHVNEMSTYHAFVLPIEDFSRVYNYKTFASEDSPPTSLKNTLNNAFGDGVNKYIRQMLVDINGGARSSSSSPTDKFMSLAKKGAVTLSASVVIQQPSAIVRAMTYVKPKYFANFEAFNFKQHNKLWEEIKEYAPVAGIKEMGYFDVGMGRSSAEWIVGDDYDGIREKMYAFFHDKDARKNLTDDFLGKAPAMADELAWVALWGAVKKETAKETNLDVGSKDFMERCGERFTNVVELTQVYDSVLSRSGYMRDKGSLMKMATAFMAEPTLQINMLVDAGIQCKRNGKNGVKMAANTVGTLIGSIVFNSLLKSIVYAARDDDEEKTQWEKYLASVVGDLAQSLNPLTMIPFAKDIVSIFGGYDVERMDMSLIADLEDSIKAIGSETKSAKDKIQGLAGSIGQLFGIPAKNVIRDVNAVINTFASFSKNTKTTENGIKFALKEEANSTVTGKLLSNVFNVSFDTSNQRKYYDAVMSGDTDYAERIESLFKNPKQSVVKALRDYDARVTEAAQAEINGNPNKRYRIAKEIVADGFKQDYVVLAIQGMISKLTKEEKDSKNKKYSLSTIDNYFSSALDGETSDAAAHKESIIESDMYNNGKTYEEAQEDFYNKFYNSVKEAINDNSITVEKASEMLEKFGNLDSESAQEKAKYFVFKRDYPDVEYNWGVKTAAKYYSVAEPAGISVEVYDEYLVAAAECKGIDSDNDGKADSGSVKEEKLEVIDSLPLSDYQKDVLYNLNGWKESTLWQAPWH